MCDDIVSNCFVLYFNIYLNFLMYIFLDSMCSIFLFVFIRIYVDGDDSDKNVYKNYFIVVI